MIYVARAFVLTPRTGVWTASGCETGVELSRGCCGGLDALQPFGWMQDQIFPPADAK